MSVLDRFDAAADAVFVGRQRIEHAARGWRDPAHPADTPADVPTLIADFEADVAAFCAAARARAELEGCPPTRPRALTAAELITAAVMCAACVLLAVVLLGAPS